MLKVFEQVTYTKKCDTQSKLSKDDDRDGTMHASHHAKQNWAEERMPTHSRVVYDLSNKTGSFVKYVWTNAAKQNCLYFEAPCLVLAISHKRGL